LWHGIFIHEFGHSFADLQDEHPNAVVQTGFSEAANMTRQQDNSLVKWAHWVGYGSNMGRRPIGIYRTGTAPTFHAVPSRDSCIMGGTIRSNFCAVCSAEITRRLASIAGYTFSSKHPDGYIPAAVSATVSTTTNRILPYAFNGNTNLRYLTIPSNITTIGDYAFLGATRLSSIV